MNYSAKYNKMKSHIKKKIMFIFFIAGCFSCNSDDDPSLLSDERLKEYAGQTFFYDIYGRLSKISYDIGEWNYKYEGSQLTEVYHRITDPMIMDGAVVIRFAYEGNKVIVERWAEPEIHVFQEEIELDENLYAVRITETGIYTYGPNGKEKVEEGETYTVFRYNTPFKDLVGTQTYRRSDSTLISSTVYEYDSNYGMMLNVASPGPWFFTYWGTSYSREVPFLNTIFNVTRCQSTHIQEGTTFGNTYVYSYNKDNLPVDVRLNDSTEKFPIKYEKK